MARTPRAIQKVTQLVDLRRPTMARTPTMTHIRIGSVVLLLLVICCRLYLSMCVNIVIFSGRTDAPAPPGLTEGCHATAQICVSL